MFMRKDQFNFKGIPRGEKKFYYKYSDISRMTGLSIGTIRNYVTQKKFNPLVLESVNDFLNKYKGTQ